jgi:hypothetical protein
MSNKVRATPLSHAPILAHPAELVSSSYELGKLIITLEDLKDSVLISFSFADVEAHRVMDEGRLLAYWPECSTPNGSIFEIHSGGWLDELRRDSSGAFWADKTLREFLVPGIGDCASVIGFSAPEIIA